MHGTFKTKADPLSIEALITWLELQPGEAAYCYSSVGHCLAAQYNKSIGRKYMPVLYDRAGNFDNKLEWIACHGERTFAGALARAITLRVKC